MRAAVLLVEDERDTRELLGRAFERAGYRCVTADGPAQAERSASDQGPFDVVVTDVVLGRDDHGGLSLMQRLRSAGVAAPFVIITAYADVEKVKIALNQGAAHLLEKPFRAPELLAVVERVRARPGGLEHAREQVLARAHLTAKERTVAIHLLEGLSSSEIAVLETNSPKTIRQHVSQIYAKCGVNTRAEFFRLVYASPRDEGARG
jgi:DNA-binding NtrC family response regulator